ncbi:hypothetical protein AKO1_000932, partial [Acrasis kona]
MELFGLVDEDSVDRELWDNIYNKMDKRPVMLVGVTGCGKTHKIIKTAAIGYLLYITAADRTDLKDDSYIELTQLTNESVDAINRKHLALFIGCRLIALLYQLQKYKITPGEYFYTQYNGNTKGLWDLFEDLISQVEDPFRFCKDLVLRIRDNETFKKYNLIGIALDECGVMDKDCANKFTS